MLAALFVLTSVATALAGAEEDCNQRTDHDRRIRGCTVIITGKQKGKASAGYHNRGLAWSAKGDNDRAIADFNQAIRLDPTQARTFAERGGAWLEKGDTDRAIADFDHAIRLNPKADEFYFLRGFARKEKGKYDQAIADYSEMVRLDPSGQNGYVLRGDAYVLKGDLDRAGADFDQVIKLYPESHSAYWNRGRIQFLRSDFVSASSDFMRAVELGGAHAMLWLFFTRARLGQDGSAELSINSAKLKDRDWPFPIIEFYLGKLPLDKLRAAADTTDKVCAMNFYVAEWHLSRGENIAAIPLLKAVVTDCPRTSNQHNAAVVELRRSGI